MSKHTKGPWWVDYESYDGGFTVGSDEKCVGLVWADNRSAKPKKRELEKARADAKLFAAAPEMLKALIVAERSIRHRDGDCYSDDYMGACVCGKDRIKAVIAKAEGRE